MVTELKEVDGQWCDDVDVCFFQNGAIVWMMGYAHNIYQAAGWILV
jgi:hypothetical protein